MLRFVRDHLTKRPMLAQTVAACSWESIGTISLQGTSVLTGLIAAQLLGVEKLGQWAIVLTLLAFFLNISSQNISRISTRFLAEFGRTNPQRAGEIIGFVWGTVAMTGAATMAVCFLGNRWIAVYFFDSPSLEPLVPAVGVAAVLTLALTCFRSILYGAQRYRQVAISNLLFSVLRIVGVCGLLVVPGLRYLVWAYVAACLLTALHAGAVALSALRQLRIRVSLGNYFHERNLFLNFCLPGLVLTMSLAPLTAYTRVLVVQLAGGMAAMAGVFVATGWQQVVVFLPYQLCRVASPIFADLKGRGRHREMVRYAAQVGVSSLVVGIGFAVALALPGKYLLRLYGDDFVEFYPLFLLVLLAGAVEACSSSLHGLYTVLDAMWWGSASLITGNVIALGCAAVLLPRLGVVGLGWALLAQHTTSLVFITTMLAKRVPQTLNLAPSPECGRIAG